MLHPKNILHVGVLGLYEYYLASTHKMRAYVQGHPVEEHYDLVILYVCNFNNLVAFVQRHKKFLLVAKGAYVILKETVPIDDRCRLMFLL